MFECVCLCVCRERALRAVLCAAGLLVKTKLRETRAEHINSSRVRVRPARERLFCVLVCVCTSVFVLETIAHRHTYMHEIHAAQTATETIIHEVEYAEHTRIWGMPRSGT